MQSHSRRAAYALQKLAEDDPTLGALALWCRHRDAELGSAGTHAWSTGEAVFYGPGFEGLAAHEQIGLAAHHILHVAFQHGPRSRSMRLRFGEGFHFDIYNIAADAIVNETLLKAGYALPRPCVSLGALLQALSVGQDVRDRSLAKLDADALYILLLHNRSPGSSGATDANETDGRAKQVRAAAAQMGFSEDFDEDQTEAGQDENDQGTIAWHQRLSLAIEQGRQAGRGIGALGLRLSDLARVQTPWEVLLRGMATKALTQERRPDHRRPARRWLALDAAARASGKDQPAFQPAFQRDNALPRIAVALDSSGSIDTERLRIFAAQVTAIARRTRAELHLLVFDEVVQSHAVLQGSDVAQSIESVLFARDGGTSFVDVIEKASALEPSVIVVLTDLDGQFGDQYPVCPVLWATPNETSVLPPFGRVLRLST